MSRREGFEFARRGVPVLVMLIGGTWGLSKVLAGKFETGRGKLQYRGAPIPGAKEEEDKFDLQKELEAMEAMWNKELVIKRVPRPPGIEEPKRKPAFYPQQSSSNASSSSQSS